jgi:CheY-like chemotaxis protein
LNLEIAEAELARASPERSATLALQSVRDALEGTERVKRIVSDLRSFARDSDDEAAAVDLEKTVSFARAIAANALRPRATLDVSLTGLPPVRGSETRLGQVFLNLILNAAQAMPDGRAENHRIAVVGHCEGDAWVVVRVSDTGAGIPPELIPRIFDPFVTSKARSEGTGLGLSIAHSIVTAMGGSISVESAVGRGTTFTLRFPVADVPMQTTGEIVPHADPRQRRTRVLLVDDEPAIRRVITQALAPYHDVTAAASGLEALALLERGDAFDAMLCDLTMPGMGGVELYDHVARRWPGLALRTGILSGGVFSERAKEFVETSGLRCLEKPCTGADLRALVDELTS